MSSVECAFSSISQISELIMSRSVNVVNLCVCVCVPVCCTAMPSSLPHLKRLGLCSACSSALPYMFPGAWLPRTLTAHTKPCAQTHTETLAQGTQGMGIHVGCLRGPDVFMSGGVALSFTLVVGVIEYTHRG